MQRAILTVAAILSFCSSTAARTSEFQLSNGLRVAVVPIAGQKNAVLTLLLQLGDVDESGAWLGGAKYSRDPTSRLNRLFWMSAAGRQKKRSWAAVKKSYPHGFLARSHPKFSVVSFVVTRRQLSRELAEVASRLRGVVCSRKDFAAEKYRHCRAVKPIDDMGRHVFLGMAEEKSIRFQNSSILPALHERFEEYAKPKNAILVVAGAVGGTTERDIKRLFSNLPSGSKTPPIRFRRGKPKHTSLDYTDPGHRTRNPKLVQSARGTLKPNQPQRLWLGYSAPTMEEKNAATSLVAVSRLKKDLRKIAGGATKVHFFPFKRPGFLAIEIALPNDVSEEMCEKVQAKMRKLICKSVKKGVSVSDRTNAAKDFAARFHVKRATSGQTLEEFGFLRARQLQLGLKSGEIEQMIGQVSSRDIASFADSFLKLQTISYVATPRVISKKRLLAEHEFEAECSCSPPGESRTKRAKRIKKARMEMNNSI